MERLDKATVEALRRQGAIVEREGGGKGPWANKCSDVLSLHLKAGRISQEQWEVGKRFESLWYRAHGSGCISQLGALMKGAPGQGSPEDIPGALDKLHKLMRWDGFCEDDVLILRDECGMGESVTDHMRARYPRKSASWHTKQGVPRLRMALDLLNEYWGG